MSTYKVTLHMVASLDGYIAKKDGDVSWMQSKDHFEGGKELTEQDIANYLQSIDCYVMGAKTYEHALDLGWPYGETPVFVLSHRDMVTDRSSVSFFSGDPDEFVKQVLAPQFKSIWLVGGPTLARTFLKQNLVDEIVLTKLPVLLGGGLLFFDQVGIQADLHLKEVTTYKDGLVEMTYQILK